ncbi:MAG TPA: phosphoribosylglycinamide formyltransferase [Negativicutes bacterium]|nr:phosphoribosylglycinamide formyltransferase [Negativicutes bacterium]
MKKLRIGVLVSGRGSNLQAIIDAVRAGWLPVEIGVVISDKPEAYALERARRADIPAVVIERGSYESRGAFEQAMLAALAAAGVELITLAGFMRILSGDFTARYAQRVINIHPALLPAFPGLHAQAQALAYGVKVTGCTVHFVDEGMDTGPIILQAAVPVEEDDTEETLSQRILTQEHRLYPLALQLLAEGRIKVEGRRVRIIREKAEGGR